MELKYEVFTISNVDGKGGTHEYIKVQDHPAMSEDELARSIEQRCTLTKGDVKAVLTTLHDYAIRELSEGNRFYVPGIGYLSLSVEHVKDEENPEKKINGKDIRVRGINFRPERELLDEVAQRVTFVRARYTSRSRKYTEEHMWQLVSDYLQENEYITSRTMESHFLLTKYTAHKWLKLFVEKGLLEKHGNAQSPFYQRVEG